MHNIFNTLIMKKTVLLLGGYGFIATNLLKYIDEYYDGQYEFIIFDRSEIHPHGISFKNVIKSYAGDFSDQTLVENIFNTHEINLVIHSLSNTVPATSNNSQYDVETNLIPTLKLLSIMDKYGVKDIVYFSSGGAIYGDYLNKVHNEDDAVYPKSSYGVVKLAIEKYLLSYAELYGFNSLILRLSNPFGRYHYNNKQGVINIAIRKALNKECLQIWGDGNGIKDYIFIDDVCEVVMQLIQTGVHTEVYNVASGVALSVNDIVEAIQKVFPLFEVEHVNMLNIDVQSFELDINKLRRKLGGYKMTSFDIALKDTIQWQRDNA